MSGEDGYALTRLRHEDMLDVMRWRNEQIDVLRQDRPLTPQDQEAYYSGVVAPSFEQDEPRLSLFSFLKDGACIGYGGLTNIEWLARRAEVSFLLDTSRAADADLYHEGFTVFLRLLKQFAFKELKLNRLFTETYDVRPAHVGILEASGFAPEGRLRQHAFVQGRLVDSLMHGILAADYEE